jgi:hypothetical protein
MFFRIETGDFLIPLSADAAKIRLVEVRGVNVIFEKDPTVAAEPGMVAPGRRARFGHKKDSHGVL